MLNKRLLAMGMLSLVAVGMVGCGQTSDKPKDDNATQQEQQVQNVAKIDVNATIDKVVEEIGENMPMTMKLTAEDMEMVYPEMLTADDVAEFCGYIPMIQSTTEFTMFKAKDGNTEVIKKALEQRQQNQKDVFEQYLPDQYDIIKESKVMVKGDYVYFISASPENFEIAERVINDAFAGK